MEKSAKNQLGGAGGGGGGAIHGSSKNSKKEKKGGRRGGSMSTVVLGVNRSRQHVAGSSHPMRENRRKKSPKKEVVGKARP